ncbi:MAG: LptA/OstA family protein [Candidatus Binatia bacterium]
MSRRRRWRGRLLGILLAWTLPVWPVASEETTGQAANTEPQKKAGPDTSLIDSLSLTSRREPIYIHSRDLEFLYDEKRITYRGDVVVKQGDVTLKSDLLTVIYEEPAKNGATPSKPANATTANATTQQRLKEIVAEGNVVITTGDRRATGKKAVFNEAKRTVVLSGDAVLQEGVNRVSGERVTVFLDEKRSIVEGGKEPAQMVFIPTPQEDGKKGENTP